MVIDTTISMMTNIGLTEKGSCKSYRDKGGDLYLRYRMKQPLSILAGGRD